MIWGPANVATLEKAAREGLTASQAAALIRCSRSAVLGKAMRLGIHFKGGEQHGNQNRIAAGRLKAEPAKPKPEPKPPRPHVAPVNNRVYVQPAAQTFVDIPDGEPGLATILTIREFECRWPIGDPGRADFTFCGRPTPGAGPYCLAHRARAFVKPSPLLGALRPARDVGARPAGGIGQGRRFAE